LYHAHGSAKGRLSKDVLLEFLDMVRTLRVIFLNERGLRAGWRLAIFIGMVSVLASAAHFIVKQAGQGNSSPAMPSGFSAPVLTTVGEVVLFLVLLFLCWIMSRIERQNVGAYGLPLRRAAWSRFWTGYLLWGFLPLSILLLIMRGLHVFYFGSIARPGANIFIWGLLWGLAFLMVGFFEEFFFRGYPLHTLAEGIGFWPAAIIMALIFARAHMGNGGETRIGVIATGFFALFAAATLRRTGDLWLAAGAHSGWDWSQSFLYGVPDSGLQTPGHLLNPHISTTAPAWLTGGTVGPEGSVLTLILWALMFCGFLWLYRRRSTPILTVAGLPQT
jgi:membrane protease YdiL (CAAX protease family)